MSLCLKRVILIVNEDLESDVVILVVTQTEAVVLDQEPIVSQSVRVEELVPFSVASSVATIHCEVNTLHLWIPPLAKLFKVFHRLYQSQNSTLDLVSHLKLPDSTFKISLCEFGVFLYKSIDDISNFWFSLFPLVLVFCFI